MSELKHQVGEAQSSFPNEEPSPVKPCPQAEKKEKPGKTWVEVQLIDMLGKPVPGAKYHVLLPNETQPRIGKLDSNGRVNFREIDPGTCMITFPDYDHGAWGKPSGRWPVQRAPFYERDPGRNEPEPAESKQADKPEKPAVEQKEKTWVEVVLLDAIGKPVPNARYKVELPGESSPRIGNLDENGRVTFHKIDPGTCMITFPDYDHGAWGKPSGRWSQKRAPIDYEVTGPTLLDENPTENRQAGTLGKTVAEEKEKTWVEFSLIDAIGKPVANARYKAVLPGEGMTRTGTLDANGRVYFDRIDPGSCTICFPDYDKEAWHNVKTTA